jgi:hypothetical protein
MKMIILLALALSGCELLREHSGNKAEFSQDCHMATPEGYTMHCDFDAKGDRTNTDEGGAMKPGP